MAIWTPEAFDPFLRLLDQTVFNKGYSDSAQERMRWNMVSWISTFQTHGLGIGMGSSRTSSWAIAAVSQLGVRGAAIMAALALRLFAARVDPAEPALQIRRLHLLRAVKACAFAWLTSIAISGSSADPGPPFFLCLATTMGLAAPLPGRRVGVAGPAAALAPRP